MSVYVVLKSIFQDFFVLAKEYCSLIYITASGLFVAMCSERLFDQCRLVVLNLHSTHFTASTAYLQHHPLPASVNNVAAFCHVFEVFKIGHC